MKIGFFTDGYLPQKNGVATSVVEYARALESHGHEVIVIAPRYPGYKDKSKNIIRLSSINFRKEIGIRIALYLPEKSFRNLLKLDFDVIHGHGDGPITMLGWTIAKRKNVPFILSHHTFWNKYTHYFPAGKLIRPRIVEKFTQVFANSCNAVISPSQMSKNELLSYGVTTPISVIQHGLDLSKFVHPDNQYLRKKYKISQTSKILLYIGRLNKEKSVNLLLEAFEKIYGTNPDTILVLLGDGPEKEHLLHMAKNMKLHRAIYFMSSIDYKNIPAVLHSADIFIFASKTETFGKVVIEAMAAGVPTVTFRIAPFTEIIQHKKDGLLVSPTASALAKGVVSLLDNEELRTILGQNALKKSKNFSIDYAVQQVEKIYIKTCKEHESRSKRGIGTILTKVKNLIDVELN